MVMDPRQFMTSNSANYLLGLSVCESVVEEKTTHSWNDKKRMIGNKLRKC